MNLVPGRVTPNVEMRSSNRRGLKNLGLKKRKYSFKYRPGSVEYLKLSELSKRKPKEEPLYEVLNPAYNHTVNSFEINKVGKTNLGLEADEPQKVQL